MTERVGSPNALWAPVAVGLYGAAIAVAPSAQWRLALAAAPCVAALGWWVLARPGRWVAAMLAATLVLPPLPVALGSTGPHPALLFAGLGLVAGLLALRRWRAPQDAAGLALVALFLALLASVPLAALYSGPWIAAASLARVLLFGISVYVYGWVAAGLTPPGGALRTRACCGLPRWLRPSSRALISTSSFPRRRASDRSSFGCRAAYSGAPRECSTKPVRSATCAVSSW